MISGATYKGVPTAVCAISCVNWRTLEIPKSPTRISSFYIIRPYHNKLRHLGRDFGVLYRDESRAFGEDSGGQERFAKTTWKSVRRGMAWSLAFEFDREDRLDGKRRNFHTSRTIAHDDVDLAVLPIVVVILYNKVMVQTRQHFNLEGNLLYFRSW